MKKSFRIISIMVAVIMVVSSVFTSMFYVSGTGNNSQHGDLYDFENGIEDIAVKSSDSNTKMEVLTDSDGNKTLSVTSTSTTGKYPQVIAIFPYSLEVGKTYELSYRYRAKKLPSNNQFQMNKQSAWSTGKVVSGEAVMPSFVDNNGGTTLDYKNIIAYFTKQPGDSRLTSSNGFNWNAFKIKDTNWHEVTFKFVASEDYVTDEYNNLALKLDLYGMKSDVQIDIDDVEIKVSPFEVKFVTNDSGVSIDSVYGYEGDVLNFPDTEKEGYTFLGWYKDADFSIPYEDTKITVPDENVTIYAKYRNNSILKIDFESDDGYLDFGVPENSLSLGADVKIMTENEGSAEENRFLRLTASTKSKSGIIVNLPFELEKGVSYNISYKIRDDGQSYLYQSEVDGAGIYIGKSTEISDVNNAEINTKDFRDDKLSAIHTDYKDNTSYYLLNSENYITVNKVFFVNESNTIDEEYKYVQLYYYPKNKNNSTDELEYLDIDDIVIQKLVETSYDFEDETAPLDFGIENNLYGKDFDEDGVVDGAFIKIMTENEGTETENKFLRIQNRNYKNSIVNFPFILEKGATYNISYKIRDDGASNLGQNEGSGAGFYIGKSTGKTVMDATAQIGVSNFLGKKMCNLYGDNGSYVALNKSEFVDVSFTFTVGENDVNDQFKYLALNYYCKEKNNSKFEYVDIDDLTIVKTPKIDRSTVSFVTNVSDIVFEDITDVVGNTRSFEYFSAYGYKLEGVYTDSAFSQPYPNNEIVFGLEDITLYVKLEETNNNILRFENDSDVVKFAGDFGFAYEPKDDGSYNRAVAMSKNDSYAVLPYMLEPNKEYVVNFKYKASSTAISPRLYILAGNAGEGSIVEGGGFTSTRQHSVFGSTDLTATEYVTVTDFDWQWREVTFKFKTNDNVTEIYDHLVLAGRVPFNINSTQVGYLYIDDFQLKEYVGEINFDVSYEGQNIDINPIYAEIGELIQLPQTVIEPFELEGWYSDSEFTQKISENEYTVTADHTTLYGKVSYKSTAHIDFEDSSQLLFSGAGWTAVMSELKTDDSDIDNHLLKMEIKRLNSSAVRLNYQFRPNRIYEISVKYRAISDTNNASLGLYALGIDNLTNGYNSLYHNPDNRPFSAVAPLVTSGVISKEWTEVTATISTDQPLIDSVYKYLCIYLSSSSSVLDAVIEIDDIIITDKGSFDPTKLDVLDSNSWTIKEEDMSIWKDSESWITGLYEQDIIEEDTYFVNEELEEDTYFVNEELEEDSYFEEDDESEEEIQQTTVKKRRKKKVVTVVKKGNWLPLIIGISVAVAVAATSVVFLIVKRRRKKTA